MHESAHAQLKIRGQRGTVSGITIAGIKPLCSVVSAVFFFFFFSFSPPFGVKGVGVGVDPQVQSRNYMQLHVKGKLL